MKASSTPPDPQKKQSPIAIIALAVIAIGMVWGLYSAMQPSDLTNQWRDAANQAEEAAKASQNNNQ